MIEVEFTAVWSPAALVLQITSIVYSVATGELLDSIERRAQKVAPKLCAAAHIEDVTRHVSTAVQQVNAVRAGTLPEVSKTVRHVNFVFKLPDVASRNQAAYFHREGVKLITMLEELCTSHTWLGIRDEDLLTVEMPRDEWIKRYAKTPFGSDKRLYQKYMYDQKVIRNNDSQREIRARKA